MTTFLFDSDNSLAGVRLYDTERDAFETHSALNADILTGQIDDTVMMESYATTRLVGLRTWKRCETSQEILQVQPIYYSVSETIC